ncbi:MAG: helix-turn-helix domain-containing protein, partial [Deltaproteobacteria bacterium]
AFMSMNLDRHTQAFRDQFRHLVDGDAVKAEAHRKFYDEYLAVMDLPAEFYLETVHRIFQRHDLPLGQMTWRDRPVKQVAAAVGYRNEKSFSRAFRGWTGLSPAAARRTGPESAKRAGVKA